jgi:Lon protease-like protein
MSPEAGIAALPQSLPVFPLVGVLLLPHGTLPLRVFEPRYLSLTEAALARGRILGMVQPAVDGGQSGASVADDAPLHAVGCAGRIVSFQEDNTGGLLITLKGLCRFRIAEELPMQDGYRRVTADYTRYVADFSEESAAIDRDRLIAALKGYFEFQRLEADWKGLDKLPDSALVNIVAMVCPFPPADKQALLESPDLEGRSKLLVGLMEAALLGHGAELRH